MPFSSEYVGLMTDKNNNNKDSSFHKGVFICTDIDCRELHKRIRNTYNSKARNKDRYSDDNKKKMIKKGLNNINLFKHKIVCISYNINNPNKEERVKAFHLSKVLPE